MDGLLLIYDKVIFFSGNLSGFRVFPDFSRIFIKSSYLFTEWMDGTVNNKKKHISPVFQPYIFLYQFFEELSAGTKVFQIR